MRSFRRNTKGQLVIIAALIMVMFTIALAYSISQISLGMQELRYEPFQEIVLNIASDFDRCLRQALKTATQEYNKTGNLAAAIAKGNMFIARWVNSTLASYSNLGLEMAMNASDYGATDARWEIDWGSSVGVSYVYTKFGLNVDAYSLEGWKSFTVKHVWLKIERYSIDYNTSMVTLDFQVMQSGSGGLEPISNLKPNDIHVVIAINNAGQAESISINDVGLTRLGNGRYEITFEAPSTAISGITLKVTTPEDGIIVSACINTEWNNIYLTNVGQGIGKETLVPLSQFNFNGRNGFVTTPISNGQEVVEVESIPTTQNITLQQSISVRLFLEPTKKVNVLFNVTFGFRFNGTTYWIGSGATTVSDSGTYIFNIDNGNAEYPAGCEGIIPEGSFLILKMAAIADKVGGSVKVWYGPDYLSVIRL